MFKNLSIRQISIYIVLVLAIINLTITLLMMGSTFYFSNFIKIILLFLVGSVISYFVVRYLLERYVFRKIKLIYKVINKSKSGKKKSETDIYSKSLESVNDDVVAWAQDTQDQLQSLQSLATYRKNFVGNVSHELKTPIFSIQGYLHTLLDGGIHDEKINIKFIKRAADNAERLKNIVDDLEAISRLESGELILDVEKFDIKELMLDVIEELSVIAKKRKIKLRLKESASPSFMVVADKSSIRQVISNLLMNSIKYGEKDGKTRVSFYDMDATVLVEISDNGLGISEEHHKHLFDRFYRVDESRSRDAGGSGLGLSIVKHILEAHGQIINVRSTENVGSTFGFTLQKA